MLSSRTFYFQECCWLFQHCKRLNVFILQKRVFPLNCNAASPNRNPKYFRCQILNHFLFPNQCNNRFKQFESTEWEIALNWLASCFFLFALTSMSQLPCRISQNTYRYTHSHRSVEAGAASDHDETLATLDFFQVVFESAKNHWGKRMRIRVGASMRGWEWLTLIAE